MEQIKILPMNLQLFAEVGGDESTVNAEPVVNVEPQQTTEPATTTEPSVNAESGEVTNPQVAEKPVQTPEENAKFAQIRRDYEVKIATEKTKAIDEYIASQGYVFDGKPITTKAEYDQAIELNDERQRQEDLRAQGIDPKMVEDYVNNNPTVKWAKEYQTKQQQEEAKQKQFLEFAEAYPDVKGDQIPAEVWQQFDQGKSLVDAYTKVENAKLKAEINRIKLETEQETIRKINNNATTSPGSAAGGNVVHKTKAVSDMTAEEFATYREEVSKQSRG